MKNKNSKMLINWSNINWSSLLIPIVNFIISNGTLSMLGKCNIYLDQFYVFADMAKVNAYDWINNSGEGRKHLVEKYFSSMTAKPNGSVKRTLTTITQVEGGGSGSGEVDGLGGLGGGLKSKKLNHLNDKMNVQLDSKLESFMSLLNHEKENNAVLKSRLVTSLVDEVPPPPPPLSLPQSPRGNELLATDVATSFDLFFKKLREEKSKNEQFNEKLSKLISK